MEIGVVELHRKRATRAGMRKIVYANAVPLQGSEAQLRAVFERVDAGIAILDAGGLHSSVTFRGARPVPELPRRQGRQSARAQRSV